MAAGKAIVSTAVGSVPTLVTHAFNGFLTQSTEAIELVEYVLTLMDSEDLRISMGMRSRERAKREFSWDGFIQAYHSMFARHIHAADGSCSSSHYFIGTSAWDPPDLFVLEAFGGLFLMFPLQMLSAMQQTE
jgi:hypothetical protein